MNFMTAYDLNNGVKQGRQSSAPINIEYKDAAKRRVLIKIDTREMKNTQLIEALKRKLTLIGRDPAVDMKVEMVNLFDIVYVAVDAAGNETFVMGIERKTIPDLSASIKGQRYTEQRGRMNLIDTSPSTKLLLCEGGLLDRDYAINPKSLLGATAKPVIRGDHDVMMTKGMESTADIIVHYLLYIEHMDELPKAKTNNTYVDFAQADVRKRDCVENNVYPLMMKYFVHGMTAEKAKAIVEVYATLGSLADAFKENKAKTLSKIASLKCAGDTRCFGPALATHVYEMMHNLQLVNPSSSNINIHNIPDDADESDNNDNNNNNNNIDTVPSKKHQLPAPNIGDQKRFKFFVKKKPVKQSLIFDDDMGNDDIVDN